MMKSLFAVTLLASLAWAPPAIAQNSQSQAKQGPVNVRLTFHLIEADGFQNDDPEIRPIVTELRKLFRFQGYKLISKSVLNGTSWPSSVVQQKLVADDTDQAFSIEADISGGNAQEIRLMVQLTQLGVIRQADVSLINASVNLQDGKTVVLGSARVSRDSGALILAVTPTINP